MQNASGHKLTHIGDGCVRSRVRTYEATGRHLPKEAARTDTQPATHLFPSSCFFFSLISLKISSSFSARSFLPSRFKALDLR